MSGPFGIIRGPREDVRLWFHASVAHYVKRRLWHATQAFRDIDGGIEMTLAPEGTSEMVSWVLSFGGKAEVLEPKKLREQVAEEAREAVARYAATWTRGSALLLARPRRVIPAPREPDVRVHHDRDRHLLEQRPETPLVEERLHERPLRRREHLHQVRRDPPGHEHPRRRERLERQVPRLGPVDAGEQIERARRRLTLPVRAELRDRRVPVGRARRGALAFSRVSPIRFTSRKNSYSAENPGPATMRS